MCYRLFRLVGNGLLGFHLLLKIRFNLLPLTMTIIDASATTMSVISFIVVVVVSHIEKQLPNLFNNKCCCCFPCWEAIAGHCCWSSSATKQSNCGSYKTLKERKTKAKTCLFVAVSTTIFTRIMSIKLVKDVWDYLKKEYARDERIRGMQSLNFIREFELQIMKEPETIK